MYYLLIVKYLNEQLETGKYYEILYVSGFKKNIVERLAKAGIMYRPKEKVYMCGEKTEGREKNWYGPRYLIVNQKEFDELKYDVANYFGN